jgi:hypothetical protein
LFTEFKFNLSCNNLDFISYVITFELLDFQLQYTIYKGKKKNCIYVYIIAILPPRALKPYCGEEVWAPQSPGELRKRDLLVRSPMLERSKCRGYKNCSPWSFRFGVGLTTPPRKYFLLRNLQRWNRPRYTQRCSVNKEEIAIFYDLLLYSSVSWTWKYKTAGNARAQCRIISRSHFQY